MGTHHQRLHVPVSTSRVVIDRDRFGHGGIAGTVLARGFSRDLIAFKSPKRSWAVRPDKRSLQKWIAHERLTRLPS